MSTNREKDRIISLVSGSLGAFGSAALVMSFLCNRHLRTPANFKVFIMSICDLSLALIMPGLTGGPCKFAAFCTTFFIVATCSWYCLIAYDLHRILNGRGVPKSISFVAHLFAWVPSTIAATAPLTTNSYGSPEFEGWLICWYYESEDILKLAIVIPLSVHMLFTVFLLGEYLTKGSNILASSPKVQKRVTRHLLLFSLVFLLTWSWLIISTVQDIVLIDERIDWLDDLSFFQFKSSGFFNFLVWINSPIFGHARHLQHRRQQQELRGLPTMSEDSEDFIDSESESTSGDTGVQQEMKQGRPIDRNWSLRDSVGDPREQTPTPEGISIFPTHGTSSFKAFKPNTLPINHPAPPHHLSDFVIQNQSGGYYGAPPSQLQTPLLPRPLIVEKQVSESLISTHSDV